MEKNPKVVVFIATHKKCDLPHNPLYKPIFVGASINSENIPANFLRDDAGKNISKKNPYFCELTALYWAWQNEKALDYIGLCHYRRFLSLRPPHSKSPKTRLQSVLRLSEAEMLLKKTNIILPKKRNYFIENLYDHYIHTLHPKPLELTRQIISERCPEYLPEFDNLRRRKTAHMFNMFIMDKSTLNNYCEWLFDILFELEKRVKAQGLQYDQFHSRFYGRISELLLDIYLATNHLGYQEVGVVSPEPANWFVKGTSFIAAKFFGKKYGKSF